MPIRSVATIPASVHITHAERDAMVPYPEVERPRTRGDCLPGGCNEERPCPFVGCKHHLYLDANPSNGSIKFNFPKLEPDQIPETCALDVAGRGRHTLKEVGEILNLTRAGVQVIEERARARLQRRTRKMENE